MRTNTQRLAKHDQDLHRGQRNRGEMHRRGAIVVLSAFLMIMMMAMLAFSIDLGYMYTMESQLQRSVDAAALAGAGSLVDGEDGANDMVVEYLVRNPVGKNVVITEDEELTSEISQFLSNHEDDLEVQFGHWDTDAGAFGESGELPSAVSVKMTYPNNPLFFSRFLGHDEFTISAESVAMYQPRDIVLVLDLSASMNDDSQFWAFQSLGREAVEANLLQCYQELGQPVYGKLDFAPKYAVVRKGISAVEYRGPSAEVTVGNKQWAYVRASYKGGSSWNSGWKNVANLTNRKILVPSRWDEELVDSVRVWHYHNGAYANIDTIDLKTDIVGTLEKALGLDHVAYPYRSGSWRSYISHCMRKFTRNYKVGYGYKFGHMNLINYWLEEQPGHDATADLWKVSAQPITAVKDAVDVFMDYIQEAKTGDRVGLSVYDYKDGDGLLESELTDDFEHIVDLARRRQAGHYHGWTNIGAGLEEARRHLESDGRAGAFKMVVLMTDGRANWINNGYDPEAARQYVLDEAALCAEQKIPIVTISLGLAADRDLMEKVANASHKGAHFNVPGEQTVEQYSAQLIEVFRDIASDRPLKLVK